MLPTRLGRRIAQIGYSSSYTTRRPGSRFFLPVEGSQAFVRSFCIPILAPDPVSAHAWLNHVIDPLTAAPQVQYSLRPTPVLAARSLLPQAIVQNPAICPPTELVPNLVQSKLAASDIGPPPGAVGVGAPVNAAAGLAAGGDAVGDVSSSLGGAVAPGGNQPGQADAHAVMTVAASGLPTGVTSASVLAGSQERPMRRVSATPSIAPRSWRPHLDL